MSDPALTPEVLEELTKAQSEFVAAKNAWAASPYTLRIAESDRWANSETALTKLLLEHAPALLATAQRVQELEESSRTDIGQISDLAAELGFVNEGGTYALPEFLAFLRRQMNDLRAHRAELEAIDAALGPLTEATRQAQVRGLVEQVFVLTLARTALRKLSQRENEDIDAWAKRIAQDVASATD